MSQGYSHFITTSLKGEVITEVFPTVGNFSRVANGVGSGSHTFQVNDIQSGLTPAQWRYVTSLKQHSIVTCYNGVPVYSGPLEARTYRRDNGTLEVQSSEFRTWLNSRLMFLVNYYGSGTKTFTGMSLQTIVREIVRYALVDPEGVPSGDGGAWRLPVDLPGIQAGSENRTYFNYNFVSPEQAVKEIQDLYGDVDFQPQWAPDGTLRQLLRIGGPWLAGPTYEWIINADNSGAHNIVYKESAQKLATAIRAIGQGSGEDIRTNFAGLEHVGGTPYLGPNIDTSISLTQIDDLSLLHRHAREELQKRKVPVNQLTFDVLASGTAHADSRFNAPSLDKLIPGSRLRTSIQDDPFIPDDWRENYLLGVSGDFNSDHVSLKVKEVIE